MSKLSILFILSAIQTLLFVIVGNLILEIEWRMLIPFWIVLFTVSCFANVLGLNISSAFNSAVTVYVLIPLLLIPQMILSGLLFSFDKLNNIISTKGKVPVVADLMASRWAYEALAVHQFKENSFQKPFYQWEKLEATTDFRSSFLVNELEKKRKFIIENRTDPRDSIKALVQKDIRIIQATLAESHFKTGIVDELKNRWTSETFTPEFGQKLESFLKAYKSYYQDAYNRAVQSREASFFEIENQEKGGYSISEAKNRYYNESLADLVKNVNTKERILEYDGELLQQINPIFVDPKPRNALDYRAHFFAPQKYLFGIPMSTFAFNLTVIWLMTLLLYVTLHFEWLRKFVNAFDTFGGRFGKSSPEKGDRK
jgi:hypothetical protein